MPVRSVHFPAPLMLVPAKDLLAKLAALKGNGSPRSPYDIQRDLNEVNALGGVPGTLHRPWRAGADWSLRVYTRRYAVRLFATERGDAYTIASAELLRLTDHQQLASACLLLRPRGWQVALTNRDVPQGTVSHWQLIAAQWTSLLSSMTVTAAADGRQAAFLDTVDRVIDAARQLKASDEDGHRYPYRQVASAVGARAGTTQRYDFTLTGTRPLEDGARVLVAPIAPMAADPQDPQTDARGGRPAAARGRVSRSSGMTVTIDFDEPVSWTDLKGQGEITLAPSDFIYRLEHEAVARFRSGHARNPGLLSALVEGRVEGTAEGSASVPYGASPSAPLAGRPARRLNPEQLKVFDKALAGPGLLAVIGPPGTGKTRTIAEIARAVAVRGQRVLVCSQSNRAVDNVLPRLPGELLAIRVGSDAVTAEGIPYLLDRQAAELREQALNIARRNLAAYRPLADAGAWAGELARALAALAGLRADLAQAQARHADARRAVGGPLTREVDEAGEAAAALAAGAKRGFEQAERLRRKSESGFALLASRRARRSAAAEGGAAAAILALRDAEAAHAAARQRLAEMTKDAPAVLDAAAEVRALRAQAEREHAAALRAARAAGELVLAMGVEQPAVREHDFDLDCDDASLAAAQAALRQWLPWLQARQELLTRWVGEAAGESEQLHPELIRYADVLAATCVGADSKAELADLDIDLAIVDEAGQIGVADVLIPLGRARRAVMVGDHLQLPPFLAGEVREWGARAGDPGVHDTAGGDAVSGLIAYLEERAAEDALYGHGLAPTQLCRLLLPVWRAQIEANIYQSQPYDLIDKYVAKAIAEGGLCSAAEVAAFYGLDPAAVAGAARFLMSVGHLARGAEDQLSLTELGWRSVRDGRRYTHSVRDRRPVLFDGFAGKPLRGAYYDEETVTFLDAAKLAGLLANASGDAAEEVFTPVMPIPLLAPGQEAVDALARLSPAERARFNLPEQVLGPLLTEAAEQVYLPAYVVRGVATGGPGGSDAAVRYLAYTQAADEADADWSRVCGGSVEVAALVENEYLSGDPESQQRSARRWIAKVFAGVPGIAQAAIEWRDWILIACLPSAAFGRERGRGPRSIGSLIRMDGGWYFRLWCDEESPRREGLLDLAGSFVGRRQQVDPDLLVRRLARFGRQLGFGPLTPAEVAALARQAGREALAGQLDRLA